MGKKAHFNCGQYSIDSTVVERKDIKIIWGKRYAFGYKLWEDRRIVWKIALKNKAGHCIRCCTRLSLQIFPRNS